MISTAWWGPTKCTRYAFLMSWENSRKLKFRNCPQSILVDTIMSNFLIHLFYSSNEVGNRMLKFTLSLTIHFDITSPWKWLLSPLLLGSWDRSGPRSLWSKRSRSRCSQKPRLVPSLVIISLSLLTTGLGNIPGWRCKCDVFVPQVEFPQCTISYYLVCFSTFGNCSYWSANDKLYIERYQNTH